MNSRHTLTLLALLLASVVSARTQTFAIDWSSLDAGGGGTSAGGLFSLSGTIGQADANPQAMAGGPYSLAGGFWSILAVPSPGAPPLSITSNPRLLTVTISWPSSAIGYSLQQTADLTTPNWEAVPQSVTDTGTTRSITFNGPPGRRFFRLFKP